MSDGMGSRERTRAESTRGYSPTDRARCVEPYLAVGQPPSHIGQHRPISPQITDAGPHCAEPIYFCRVVQSGCACRSRDCRYEWNDGWSGTEGMGETRAVSLERTLKVSLKPHDNKWGILPVVADLTTTDESAWFRSIGLAETGNSNRRAGNRNRI